MRISDWSSDVCSSDLFIGQYLGQQRINPLPQLSLRHDHDDLPILGNFQESAHDMLALGCLQIGRMAARPKAPGERSEEHTSELQSLMRISYAVFCLKKKKYHQSQQITTV